MLIRKAEKAGTWYPSKENDLYQMLEIMQEKAKQKIEKNNYKRYKNIDAIIVPHAGLSYSGQTATLAYQLIKENNQKVDTFIILGNSHRMYLDMPAVWACGRWQTPIGDLEVDRELAKLLIEQKLVVENILPHYNDNSIELQIPIIKKVFPNSKIVPIMLPVKENMIFFGKMLAEIVRKCNNYTVAISSTDLTHYGKNFGLTTTVTWGNALEWVKKNDQKIITAIENMQAEKIIEIVRNNNNACGASAIVAALAWAKEKKAEKSVLLEYVTSYDVNPQGNPDNFVAYAAMCCYK